MATHAKNTTDVQVDWLAGPAMARPPIRRLILHADDYGLNRATTEGVVRGFRHGLLTSTAVIANAPHASEALSAWKHLLAEWHQRSWPSAAVRRTLGDPPLPPDMGVHLNLTQGRPLTGERYPAELLDAEGRFPGVWKLFFRLRRPSPAALAAIRRELVGQVELVLDHGVRPTHLNGHQYIELIPAIGQLMPELLERFGIAVVRSAVEPGLLRSTVLSGFGPWIWLLGQVKRYFATRQRLRLQARGLAFPDAVCGTVHAARITSARMVEQYLQQCTAAQYVEIVFHPAVEPWEPSSGRCDGWHDPLEGKRPKETRLLTSAELARCIAASGRTLGRLQQLAAGAHTKDKPNESAC